MEASNRPTYGERGALGSIGKLPEALSPAVMSKWSDEETNEPLIADHRNFYKVEKWTKDGARVERMLYAGSNLDKAREIFAAAIYHRPRIRLQVLEQWLR
jgi:hypothetical protein